jgi:UDP-GlcNAc:undecaprenyl-phosphate GlcNAc-1-phosphate transferase
MTVIMAMVLGLVLTPLFIRLAEKFSFYDKPSSQSHKKHARQIPLLGGPAVFLAWIITVVAGYSAVNFLRPDFFNHSVAGSFSGVQAVLGRLFFICLGAFIILLLGLYDDRFNMRAGTKLIGQIAAAAIAVSWGGVHITLFFENPLLIWLFSVFWVLLVINSINFFDNMDGLAAGTATITLGLFSIAAAMNQQYFIASLGAAAAGASMGFWFFNHTPASVFMGDSGSHFLGYLIAIISANVTYYNPAESVTKLPILIPLFILAIPLYDTVTVIVIRLYNHQPVYIGDNNHISHRFVRMGMSRKTAVFLVHLLEIITGVSVLPLMWGDERTTVVVLLQAAVVLLFISVIQYSTGHEEATGRGQG